MPVRVLDRYGSGQADDIARGIRFAVDHGADVINMSFNFGCGKRVPVIDEELRRAHHMGVVTVASIGNLGSETCVSPPATGPGVIGVGGTTEGGCLGDYSLAGKGVDVVAPGGGPPVAGCPSVLTGPIYQVTLKSGDPRRLRRARRLRRHLDGRRPRLRGRGDGPRLRRPLAEAQGGKARRRRRRPPRRDRAQPRPATRSSRAPA